MSEKLLILTPIRDAAENLDTYVALLERLTYPREHTSLALLEGDSRDGTWGALVAARDRLARGRRRCEFFRRDFGFVLPAGVPRWAPAFQIPRRAAIAKARNHLLLRALDDEDWVLWIDADVVETPKDVVEQLLAAGRDIVQPHCVKAPGGPTFDRNAWRDQGRLHLEDLRREGDLVRLDAVGGTMLLVRADLHRDGLVFPPFPYGGRSRGIRDPNPMLGGNRVGEIETEGLGFLAQDMGHASWGMPNLEIRHRDG